MINTFDDDLEDSAVLIRRGTEQLVSAKSNSERLEAVITWLRGAATGLEDYGGIYPSSEGSPGTVLLAALEDLKNGVTPPLLKARSGGSRQRLAIARAKARAVAAVDILLEVQRRKGAPKNVSKAVGAVSHACGLRHSALTSLRDHVNARTKYEAVCELLDDERADLWEMMRQHHQLFEDDPVQFLLFTLRGDRLLLQSK